MLQIMFECAENYDGFVGCDIYFVNDKILSALEEFGMIPPVVSLCDGERLRQREATELFEMAWQDHSARWEEEE